MRPIIAVCLTILLALPPALLHAAQLKSPRDKNGAREPYVFAADDVQFDQDLGLVVDKGHVEISQGDQILLVTDAGQLIRCPVSQIRVAARNTQGVTIFRTAPDEHVVSVERLAEAGGDEGQDDANGADETP